MNIRIELIRRVQAGDPVAAQTLVEQYQPIVFRIALSILDHPGLSDGDPSHIEDSILDAADASRESLTAALNRIDTLSAAADFSAWLTHIVVQTCQARLNRRRNQLWMETIQRAVFRSGRSERAALEQTPPRGEREDDLWQAFLRMEDRDRLALVLRYDHHMLPHEIVLAMGGRERVLQARLFAARERLRAAWAQLQSPPQPVAATHPQTIRWIQSAADRQITDKDAAELDRHLKSCAACQAAMRQFSELEEALRTLFHRRWDQHPAPAPDFTRSVLDTRRRGHASRNVFNLVGATLVTLMVVAGVLLLPAMIPSAPLPAAPTSRPTAVIPASDPALLSHIYPGRLAFATGQGYGGYQGTTGHLLTMLPNGSDIRDLEVGLMGISSPVWSPDGSRIAYLGYPDGNGSNQVFVAQADGSAARQISVSQISKAIFPRDEGGTSATPTPQPQPNRYPLYGQPQWSPDSLQVVTPLWLSPDSSYLVVLFVDESPARFLEVDGLDRTPVNWSPDGRSIAYVNLTGSALWLWSPHRLEAAGRNPRQVEFGQTWDVIYGMDWSPDSKQIALLTGVDQNQVAISLYIINPSERNVEVAPVSAGTVARGRIRNSSLAWSPDGRYLVFNLAYRDSDPYGNRLLLIRPDGSELQTLVNMDRGVREFTWSPDGRWIAFTSGLDMWAASMDAFELNQTYLVKLAAQAGFQLSWQTVR